MDINFMIIMTLQKVLVPDSFILLSLFNWGYL